jgi:hypothetical protein
MIVRESGEITKRNGIEDFMRDTSPEWFYWFSDLCSLIKDFSVAGRIEAMVDIEIRKRWVDRCVEDGNYETMDNGRNKFPPTPDTQAMREYRDRRLAMCYGAWQELVRQLPMMKHEIDKSMCHYRWVGRISNMIDSGGKRIAGKIMFKSGMIGEEPNKTKRRT